MVPAGSRESSAVQEAAVDKRISSLTGADELKEMERMASKDIARAKMVERGLSTEQIAAYLGE